MEDLRSQPLIVSPNPSGNGIGGKVAITIVILVLLIGAFYFFGNKRSVEEPSYEAEIESLNSELDIASEADIEADLDNMDKEFAQ